MKHRSRLGCALALLASCCLAQARPAEIPAPSAAPATIALLSVIGDSVQVVRQKQSAGSHLEPFTRRQIQINGQALNHAVLRGLDEALAQEEPASQRVFLSWTRPASLSDAMDKVYGRARDELLFRQLLDYLRPLQARQQWTRIEVMLPHYAGFARQGMASKLGGIGLYVQPLARTELTLDDDGELASYREDRPGDYATVNPKTGEKHSASTYIAPFVYFERVTLDARSLEVLARKAQFDNVKYNDPNANVRDVSEHLSMGESLLKLGELMQRAAYRSVRGNSSVEVSPVRPAGTSSDAKP